MDSKRRIGLVIALLTGAGLTLFILLLARHGVADVAAAFAHAGWGLLAVLALHVVTLFVDSLSWRALLPAAQRPSIGRLFHIHWIGDAVSSLLPVAQVGGEVVRVRLVAKRGVSLPAAAASVLVGMTLSVATQILFTLAGLGTLLFLLGPQFDGAVVRTLLLASLLGIACAAGFYFVQRVGMFRIAARIIAHIAQGNAWSGLVDKGAEFDREIRATYARTPAILESAFWSLVCWTAGAGEVWIALRALGIPASFAHALVLESVSQGVRSAFFLVPGAIGFQEGGFVGIGALFQISAANALALSLIHRAREIIFGIPGLIAWQFLEGRGFWRRDAVASATPQQAP